MVEQSSSCHWLKVYEEYDDSGVLLMIRWSHTPEEFVKELIHRDEYVMVATRCCKGCYCLPGKTHLIQQIYQQERGDFERKFHFLECSCTAAARFLRMLPQDSFVLCFGYYYTHAESNVYLWSAYLADRVKFHQIDQYPSFQSTGLLFKGFDTTYP